MKVTYQQLDDLTILSSLARSLISTESEVILSTDRIYFLTTNYSALYSHLGYNLTDSAITLLDMHKFNKAIRGK